MCNPWSDDRSKIIHSNRTLQRDLNCFWRSINDTDMCTNRKHTFGCLRTRLLLTYRHIRTAPRTGSTITKNGDRSGDPLPSRMSTDVASLRARGLRDNDLYSAVLDHLVHRRATHCQTATPFRATAIGSRRGYNCLLCNFKHARYTTQGKRCEPCTVIPNTPH
jgi:hypothetical protein